MSSTHFQFGESTDIRDFFFESNQQMQKQKEWRPPYVNLPLFDKIPSFETGDVIHDRYEVKKLLHGSMGDVYQCYDRNAKCDIAMKTLISRSKSDRMRLQFFYEEIEERLKLDRHQNVVYLKYVELIEGYPYTVSEWVEGDQRWGNSLASWMELYSFSIQDIVYFLLQITEGLNYCYEKLSTEDKCFVIGDLKPENILVAEGNIFKLMDFSTHSYTEKWASPEQKRREQLDARSDIYTVGRIACEMLKKIHKQEAESLAGRKVKELVERCMAYERQARIESYVRLDEELKALCMELDISVPKHYIQYRTSLDCLYRLHSLINLGRKVPTYTLNDWSYLQSGKRITMDSFIESVRIKDQPLYEAEAAMRLGETDKAMDILDKNSQKLQDLAKYHYIRGLALYVKNDLVHAIDNFEKASEKELYFPALDMEADIMLLNPSLFQERQGYKRAQMIADRLFHSIDKKATGYLVNQVYGKFLMLLGDYRMASRALQESLNYPNSEEWNTLYLFGTCESNQGNQSISDAVFSSVIEIISSDPEYISNGRKAVTLLFCWIWFANEDEAEKLMLAVREKTGQNYQYLTDSLHRDREIHASYLKCIQDAEERYTDPMDLRNSMHWIMNSLERTRPIQNSILLRDIVMSVCFREVVVLFNLQKYEQAITVCDRALVYDRCNPVMLQNKGACYFMMGEFLLAHCCYVLAEHYELDSGKREKAKQIREMIRREHLETV